MTRFPPRRIIAAVDLSAPSGAAWRAARSLAERYGASLKAVYCDVVPPELRDLPAPGAAEERRRVVALLRRRLGPGAKLHVLRGSPAAVLPRLARDLRCDLLVLGTHRRGPVLRALLGSVAAAVVREAPCPVLVVPRVLRPIRSVLAPVNAGPYARVGLAAAAVVARAHHARLRLLNVVTDPVFGPRPQPLLRRLARSLPAALRRDVPTARQARAGAPVREILRACRGCDLIVLTARRKDLLEDWILGTTAERVIRRSPVPVLAVPSRRP